jgi:hypothetical protein
MRRSPKGLEPGRTGFVTTGVVTILAVLFSVLLAFPLTSVSGAAETAAPTLEAAPDDDSDLARLKAAMRIFAAYGQVELICRQCGHPEILQGYSKANGTVVAHAVKIMRDASALTPEWKGVVQEAAESGALEASKSNSCSELGRQIRAGDWALHQGRFQSDYNLIRGR